MNPRLKSGRKIVVITNIYFSQAAYFQVLTAILRFSAVRHKENPTSRWQLRLWTRGHQSANCFSRLIFLVMRLWACGYCFNGHSKKFRLQSGSSRVANWSQKVIATKGASLFCLLAAVPSEFIMKRLTILAATQVREERQQSYLENVSAYNPAGFYAIDRTHKAPMIPIRFGSHRQESKMRCAKRRRWHK